MSENKGPVSDPSRIDHTAGLLWDTVATTLSLQGRECVFWTDVPLCLKPNLTQTIVSGLNTLATMNVITAREADGHRGHVVREHD